MNSLPEGTEGIIFSENFLEFLHMKSLLELFSATCNLK